MNKKYQPIATVLMGLCLSGPLFAADPPYCDLYCYDERAATNESECRDEQKSAAGGKGPCFKTDTSTKNCNNVVTKAKKGWCFKHFPGSPSRSMVPVDLGTMRQDPAFEDAFILRLQDVTDEQRNRDDFEVLVPVD